MAKINKKSIIELSNDEAKHHFLKTSSYFNNDLPSYISFEPILTDVMNVLKGNDINGFKSEDPSKCSNVNYSFLTNKDGKFAWRPLELIHPAIYVSLINLICESANWETILQRFSKFRAGAIECCSLPMVSTDQQKDVEKQITTWWQKLSKGL